MKKSRDRGCRVCGLAAAEKLKHSHAEALWLIGANDNLFQRPEKLITLRAHCPRPHLRMSQDYPATARGHSGADNGSSLPHITKDRWIHVTKWLEFISHLPNGAP